MYNHKFTGYRRGVFPKPREMQEGNEVFVFSDSTTIIVSYDGVHEAASLLQELLFERIGVWIPIETIKDGNSSIGWNLGITNDLKTYNNLASMGNKDGLLPEGYALSISKQGVLLTGSDRSGTIYGMDTLLALCHKNEKNEVTLPSVTIRDWPEFSRRGVHLYLPPREAIEGFKRIIRTLVFLKMNLLIIEVGGGMELENHPEINQDWERFCREALAFPGGPQGLQASQAYWKDSTHVELAGGSYLTKSEVKDIVQYAKRFGMDVVPEIQALSHAYYLCYSHKEIAERPQEPFPDTFCPSNPDSFKLYFEVAAEIIEVFQPSLVSIGLDEVRILAECPKCQDRTGHELLTDVIIKMHDYYTAKGIRIMMWAEKLQNFMSYDGIMRGGVFEERTDSGYWRVPATYEAIDRIPKDILMLDWYHSLGHSTESEFIDKGFAVMFGNFDASQIADWKKRSSHEGFQGAEVSTWCRADEYTIGRNNQMYQIVFSAGALWTGGSEDEAWMEADQQTIAMMPTVKSMMQQCESTMLSEDPTDFKNLYVPELMNQEQTQDVHSSSRVSRVNLVQGSLVNDIFTGMRDITRIPQAKDEISVKVDGYMKCLIFIHASTEPMDFIPSWNFQDMGPYKLGQYEIQYADDACIAVDIQYGIHLGRIDMDWGRHRSIDNEVRVDVEQAGTLVEAAEVSLPPYYNMAEAWRGSLMYFTIPLQLQTGEGMKTCYAYEWNNPFPEKQIQSVRWVLNAGKKQQSVIVFGIMGAQFPPANLMNK